MNRAGVATLLFGVVSVGGFVATACSGTATSRMGAAPAASSAPAFVADDGGKGCVSSPGNYDIPGDGCDNDGDGNVDNEPNCDDGLAASGSAEDFAKALGLCTAAQGASDKSWGLVSATYTRGYKEKQPPVNDGMHGILPKFGQLQPTSGTRIGVLSSGYAREFDDLQGKSVPFMTSPPMATSFGSPSGSAPPGFPKSSGGCSVSSEVNDVSAIRLEIKVPDNAKGVSFDFNFYSSEWPQFICSTYNDSFIAYLKSSAFNGGLADNISFDSQNNPVNVNNGFFDRCTPGTQLGCSSSGGGAKKVSTCAGGESELTGTGFFNKGTYCGAKQSTGGGATGWLTSTAPVTPGEVITLEFMIWDTGDSALDSSVLLDHLTWEPGEVVTQTVRPN